MANPQLEDGHVRIANEVVEQLSKINLSPYESRVLWAIWRKTYGWHKKADRISYTQFQQATSLDRWHIARAIKRLKARNIIAISGNKHKLIYSFEKNYEKWQTLPVQATDQALPVEATNSLPVEANTKAKNIYTKTMDFLPLVKGLKDLKNQITKLTNKKERIGFCIDAFKFYHSNAPSEDLENLGPRIAGILKSISYDYGFLLDRIWNSRAINISGSHLNYIQGMIKGKDGVRLQDSGMYKEL